VEAPVDALEVGAIHVDDPVRLDVLLERVPDGVVVRGTVHAHWKAECGICLRDIDADLDQPVGELYEFSPPAGETYRIEGTEIDLEQLVRDAVVLELPLLPTCATIGAVECTDPLAPPVQDDTSVSEPFSDPRWAGLSELEL